MITLQEKLRRTRAYFESYGGTMSTQMHAMFLLDLVDRLMQERDQLRREVEAWEDSLDSGEEK